MTSENDAMRDLVLIIRRCEPANPDQRTGLFDKNWHSKHYQRSIAPKKISDNPKILRPHERYITFPNVAHHIERQPLTIWKQRLKSAIPSIRIDWLALKYCPLKQMYEETVKCYGRWTPMPNLKTAILGILVITLRTAWKMIEMLIVMLALLLENPRNHSRSNEFTGSSAGRYCRHVAMM